MWWLMPITPFKALLKDMYSIQQSRNKRGSSVNINAPSIFHFISHRLKLDFDNDGTQPSSKTKQKKKKKTYVYEAESPEAYRKNIWKHQSNVIYAVSRRAVLNTEIQ